MTRQDAAYEITRRARKAVVVTRVTDTSSDPETGLKTPVIALTIVRNTKIEPTRYTQLLRSDATNQRIGSTTIIMWTKDLDFTELTTADHITVTATGKKFEVIESSVEDTTFMVTVEEIGK